jgi:hypothetical protein
VMHSARRQAALPVPPAVFDRLRISLAYLDRLQLRKDVRPEQWREVLIEQIAIAFMGFRRNVRLDVRAAVEAGEQEITELHAKLHAAHDRVTALMARQRTLEQHARATHPRPNSLPRPPSCRDGSTRVRNQPA